MTSDLKINIEKDILTLWLLPLVVEVLWVDTLEQKLEESELADLIRLIHSSEDNVLVHCAQGKSRSGTICICYLLSLTPSVGVSQVLQQVKLKRQMAQPNLYFMEQLEIFYREGFFHRMAEELRNDPNSTRPEWEPAVIHRIQLS